jgi:hypothetical protein
MENLQNKPRGNALAQEDREGFPNRKNVRTVQLNDPGNTIQQREPWKT